MKALMEEGLPTKAVAVNQLVSIEASTKIVIMIMISIGTPFDMLSRLSPKIVLSVIAAVLILVWSWGFWLEISGVIARLWTARPETIVGAAMIVLPLLAAGPLHYFLNVRRTSVGGVIEVNGLADYLTHGVANFIVRYGLIGSILVGIFILLFGWDIR